MSPDSGMTRPTSRVLAVGARREVLARYSQLLALSSHGGAWYAPGDEQRRTEMLSRHFAQRLKRRVT